MKLQLSKNLTPLKQAALAEVDAQAEEQRARHVTVAPGMTMVYEQKYEEAKAYVAEGHLKKVDAPHLAAEIGITGPSMYHVAMTVLNMRGLWVAKSADIEKLRMGAHSRISAAQTPAEIEEAAKVEWPDGN